MEGVSTGTVIVKTHLITQSLSETILLACVTISYVCDFVKCPEFRVLLYGTVQKMWTKFSPVWFHLYVESTHMKPLHKKVQYVGHAEVC